MRDTLNSSHIYLIQCQGNKDKIDNIFYQVNVPTCSRVCSKDLGRMIKRVGHFDQSIRWHGFSGYEWWLLGILYVWLLVIGCRVFNEYLGTFYSFQEPVTINYDILDNGVHWIISLNRPIYNAIYFVTAIKIIQPGLPLDEDGLHHLPENTEEEIICLIVHFFILTSTSDCFPCTLGCHALSSRLCTHNTLDILLIIVTTQPNTNPTTS